MMAADNLFTHTHSYHLIHTFLLDTSDAYMKTCAKKRNTDTLQEKLKHMRAETLTTVASNIASLKGELTTQQTKTQLIINWGEQRFEKQTREAFRHEMAQYLAVGDDRKRSRKSHFPTDSSSENAMLYCYYLCVT